MNVFRKYVVLLTTILFALALVFVPSSTSSLFASPSSALKPQATFWPLPAYGSGNQYWWSYTRHTGGANSGGCQGSNAGKKVVVGADYLQDYAFGNNPSNPQNLLSI